MEPRNVTLPVTQNDNNQISATDNTQVLLVTQNNDNLVAEIDSVTSNTQPHNPTLAVEALLVTQPKKRNKAKRLEPAANLKRISFGGTGNTKRFHVTLEAEYVEALKHIAKNTSH